jgi:hypothetical protein
VLNSNNVRSRFNILCPTAQLLISDRPANSPQNDLANRLGRKERAPSLANSTATESESEETAHGHAAFGIRDGGLSMVLPKSVLQTHALGEFQLYMSSLRQYSVFEIVACLWCCLRASCTRMRWVSFNCVHIFVATGACRRMPWVGLDCIYISCITICY